MGLEFGVSPPLRRKNKRVKDGKSASHKCTDCGTRQFLSVLEMERKFKPRCMHCGGTLIETKATYNRLYKARHKKPPNLPNKCEFCKKGFRNPAALRLHIYDNHEGD